MSSVIEGGIKKKEETDQLIQFEITDIDAIVAAFDRINLIDAAFRNISDPFEFQRGCR